MRNRCGGVTGHRPAVGHRRDTSVIAPVVARAPMRATLPMLGASMPRPHRRGVGHPLGRGTTRGSDRDGASDDPSPAGHRHRRRTRRPAMRVVRFAWRSSRSSPRGSSPCPVTVRARLYDARGDDRDVDVGSIATGTRRRSAAALDRASTSTRRRHRYRRAGRRARRRLHRGQPGTRHQPHLVRVPDRGGSRSRPSPTAPAIDVDHVRRDLDVVVGATSSSPSTMVRSARSTTSTTTSATSAISGCSMPARS